METYVTTVYVIVDSFPVSYCQKIELIKESVF